MVTVMLLAMGALGVWIGLSAARGFELAAGLLLIALSVRVAYDAHRAA